MEITYLPYLHMEQSSEISFPSLNVKVWNYGLKAEEYIPDDTMRETVGKFMHANVNQSNAINDMGIISIGNVDFRQYTPQESALCREVVLLLFIASFANAGTNDRYDNAGLYVKTAENFTTIIQRFNRDGTAVAISDGLIIQMLIGGYSIDEVKFQMPFYTPTPFLTQNDGHMIKALLLMRKHQKRLYARLMRAIDAFMQAYYNDSKMTLQSRILLIASAYEILFDIPESGQRRELKSSFKALFVQPTDIKVHYKSPRGRGTPQWETESIMVYWADRFYLLRNKIIHGGKLVKNDYFFRDQSHFIISTLFFALGLKKVIGTYNHGLATRDRIEWKKTTDMEGNEHSGFSYIKRDHLPDIAGMLRASRRRSR